MRRRLALSIAFVVVAVAVGPIAGEVVGQTPNGTNATIDSVYPNPIAAGDVGEYVVLSIPAGTALENATLSDGSDTVSLANLTHHGRVAVSTDPAAAANITSRPVANVSGLELANSGETITLRVDGTVASRLRYTDAPEGESGVLDRGHLEWEPLGATDFDVAVAGQGTVRAFVLPDSPNVPIEVLRSADDRILLGGYTLTSKRVADELIRTAQRGATVRVLLEGKPVGGRSRAGATQLDRLAAAGVDVRVVAGPYARVTYHHAKYAVADHRALVMTENWKPAGTGGNSSRGWGVVTRQSTIVENLTAVFETDTGWRDAIPWTQFRRGKTFQRGGRSTGEYPTNFRPATIQVNQTELLVTPDNAGDRIVRVIDGANESIAVIQASIGDWNGRLPTALRRAARRGVDVRILLSSAWYSKEENSRKVKRFRQWAKRTGAPLSAQLAEPKGRFKKIHAKGAVVDDSVVVGSLNWNDASATSNREVILVVHGTKVADYYRSVFDTDWRGGGGVSLPLGVLFALVGFVLLAGAILAKIRFEGDDPAGVGPPAGGD